MGRNSCCSGLNKGYSNEGSGGFNSGMESRDTWMPKTVDQLRAKTNPKMSFGGQMLGAYKPNKSGVHGRVEKNRPDTYFVNSEDRWFTTTGLEKAQRARGTVNLKPEHRAYQTREYYGQSMPEANGIYTHAIIREVKNHNLNHIILVLLQIKMVGELKAVKQKICVKLHKKATHL